MDKYDKRGVYLKIENSKFGGKEFLLLDFVLLANLVMIFPISLAKGCREDVGKRCTIRICKTVRLFSKIKSKNFIDKQLILIKYKQRRIFA